MNSRKRVLPGQERQQKVSSHSRHPQPQRHGAIQPKTALAPPPRKIPTAPPVYRPQPVPRVLQAKQSGAPQPPLAARGQHAPIAPPVYRPQPTPKVLQGKMKNELNQPGGTGSNAKQPVAPPVFRPQPTPHVLQLKARVNAPGIGNRIERPNPLPNPPVQRPHREADAAKSGGTAHVLQRKSVGNLQQASINPATASGMTPSGFRPSSRYNVIQRTQVSVNGNPVKEISDMTWAELAWVMNSYAGSDVIQIKAEAEAEITTRLNQWETEVQDAWNALIAETEIPTEIARKLTILKDSLETITKLMMSVDAVRNKVIGAKKDAIIKINAIVLKITAFGNTTSLVQKDYFNSQKIEGLNNLSTNYTVVTTETTDLINLYPKLFGEITKVLGNQPAITMANKVLTLVTDMTRRNRYLAQIEETINSWNKINPGDLRSHLETIGRGNDEAAWKGGAAELLVAHWEIENGQVDTSNKLVRLGKHRKKHGVLQHAEIDTQDVDVSFDDTGGTKTYIEVKADPAALIKSNNGINGPKQINVYTRLRDNRVNMMNKKGNVKKLRKIIYICTSTVGWMNLYKKNVMQNIAQRDQTLQLGRLRLNKNAIEQLVAKIDHAKQEYNRQPHTESWDDWEEKQNWRKPEDFLNYYAREHQRYVVVT
ncbi:MAG TPA: hypothetical protein VJT09_16575 [Pyrinomonadaceae bacterium]|nr:hypothetical protein [Pyrinomonadaceae bacterium]